MCMTFFPLGAKSALLIDCYFNETSWYQLRKDIFIRYNWADSHVESIWCKTWTHPVLRYLSKYFLWNRKITKELEIRRWKKELKNEDDVFVFPPTTLRGWGFGHLQIHTSRSDGDQAWTVQAAGFAPAGLGQMARVLVFCLPFPSNFPLGAGIIQRRR